MLPTPTRRSSPQAGVAIAATAALTVVVSIVIIERLGPVDPYHQAAVQAMRSELRTLPPYPESDAIQTLLRASLLDYPSSMEVIYGSEGVCADVEAYYASNAQAVSWTTAGPLQRFHNSFDPPSDTHRDQLEATYRKTAHGFALKLVISCFTDPSFQSGYVVDLDAS